MALHLLVEEKEESLVKISISLKRDFIQFRDLFSLLTSGLCNRSSSVLKTKSNFTVDIYKLF